MSDRYTAYNYQTLLETALSRVDNALDKREGSIIYDAIAPACYELAEMYLQLDTLLDSTFADTSTGEQLTRRALERGVIRDSATKAIRKGEFNIVVSIGDRFRLNDTTYIVLSLISDTDYMLQCEQYGYIGNYYSGAMLPISYIAGLEIANLTDILIPGEDEMTDSALRVKYYADLSSQAFGGNQTDYIDKTNALAGVGGTKVYPVWNGGGTVKLVIIDSTYAVPSGALVDSIQTSIDPVVNGGEGLGIAPIGHVVTVEGLTSVTCDIDFTLTFESGVVWADVEAEILVNIEGYMLQLRQDWSTEQYLIVRVSSIESTILDIVGILDIETTTINTLESNLSLNDTQIPILGTVTNI